MNSLFFFIQFLCDYISIFVIFGIVVFFFIDVAIVVIIIIIIITNLKLIFVQICFR